MSSFYVSQQQQPLLAIPSVAPRYDARAGFRAFLQRVFKVTEKSSKNDAKQHQMNAAQLSSHVL
jgi:hypothetical protein